MGHADRVFPIRLTLTALARTLLAICFFHDHNVDDEVDDNVNYDDNDEKYPGGSVPPTRKARERATKGVFLQPLWNGIYCQCQTEKAK